MKLRPTLTLFITLGLLLISVPMIFAGPRDQAPPLPDWSRPTGYKDQPPPLPGWSRSTPYTLDDSLQGHGILLAGGPIIFGSPVIAEIDGVSSNGLEVAVGGSDGRFYVYRADGSLLWTQMVPIAGCRQDVSLITSKPSVGALFGDGVPYVLIGYGAVEDTVRVCDGGVIAYRGSDGSTAWDFSQRDFDLISLDGPEALYGVITSPALADADGNGQLEIAFGGLDRNVYLLNANGSLRWYYHAADTVWSTPLFMNIDSDAELELIVATDISANPAVIPPTHDGGFLQAFETAPVSGGRIVFQTGFIWRVPFEQVLYSSPLVADLLPSNPGQEIAVGSGCFFPMNSSDKLGRWIKIVRPADGSVLQTLNAPACIQSSPAAGDINGDGQLEIVATVSGHASIGGDGLGRIVAWNPNNPNPIWATATGDPNSGSNDAFGGDRQSVVIADLDGNGSLEVIAANFWSVHVLAGTTGQPLTCQGSNCAGQISLFAWETLKSTPAVGDINADGVLDLVIGGSHIFNSSRGHLYAWTNFAGLLNSAPGSQTPYTAPWPQFRRDALASGNLSAPQLVVANEQLTAMVSCANARSVQTTVTVRDSPSTDWQVVVTNNPAPGLFTPVKVGSDLLRIDFSVCGRAVGTYRADLEVEAEGAASVPISLTVRVVNQIFEVALPLVRR